MGCEIFYKAKQQKLPFNSSIRSTSQIFELIHLDLWGPYKQPALDGSHYVFTIVDDYSRATWTYLMKTKHQTLLMFIHFCNMIQNQFDKRIKTIRTDNGSEFINHEFQNYLSQKGILHQKTCVYTP